MHISEYFLCSPCHPFLCPLLLFLSNVLCPMSHGSALSPVLCPLSNVFMPCLPSAVPSLMSLFLVYCALSHVSVPCLSVFVSCLTGFVPCFPYSFLRPLTPINYHSVPFTVTLFHCSCPLFLCFPSSVPPSLVLCSSVPRLMSSVPCLMSSVPYLLYLRESEFS